MLCHARSWAVAGAYLGCFGFGTFLAMSAFTALVGELSSQLGRKFDDPSAPAKFAKVSSIIALTMGTFWTVRALFTLGFFEFLASVIR